MRSFCGLFQQAHNAALAFGLEIAHVICLVDREEGGRENLAARGYKLDAVFTRTSLVGE
ncbi:MAG: hypothetical protein OXL41_13230 [Nitrospinae bacterium]|nr:hypothetical protein [Nitrospinota bacterium]